MFKQLALTSALALSLSGPALAFGGPAPFDIAQVTDNSGTSPIMSEHADQKDIEQHATNPNTAVGNGGDANDIDNSAMVSFPWLLLFLIIAAGLAVWYFRIRKRDPLTR